MKSSKQKLYLVGIDVSSKELVVKIEKDGVLQSDIAQFENVAAGHRKLAKYLTKNGYQARVCMEATGIYHFELALHLFETKNIEVMVVNPKAIKHFAIASMKRAKTDPLDAETILSYLKCMDFVAWKAPDQSYLQLQAISRRLYQIKAEITRESNRKHVSEYSSIMEKTIEHDIDLNIRHLKKTSRCIRRKGIRDRQRKCSIKKEI